MPARPLCIQQGGDVGTGATPWLRVVRRIVLSDRPPVEQSEKTHTTISDASTPLKMANASSPGLNAAFRSQLRALQASEGDAY